MSGNSHPVQCTTYQEPSYSQPQVYDIASELGTVGSDFGAVGMDPEDAGYAQMAKMQDAKMASCVSAQMAKMQAMPLLKADLDFAGKLSSVLYKNQSAIHQVLPARLNMLTSSVEQLRDVLGARFAEVMLDGVPDVDEASRILQMMTGQLFDVKSGGQTSILESLRDEVATLKQDYKAEHGGLQQRIHDKKKQLGSQMMLAKMLRAVYMPVGVLFNPSLSDFLLYGAPILAVLLVTVCMGWCARLVPLVVCTTCMGVLKMKRFGDCTDFGKIEEDLALQLDNADKIACFCDQMECLLAEIEKEFKTLELHRVKFEHQTDQIKVLMGNRADVGRWNAERLGKFLKEQDLPEASAKFVQGHISGKAFLELVDETQLQEAIGIQSKMEVSRLMHLRDAIKGGRFMEPSANTKELVHSIEASLKALGDNLQHIKTKIQHALVL